MNLLVGATSVVVPLELIVSIIVLYVYDRWSSLSVSSFELSSFIFIYLILSLLFLQLTFSSFDC